MNKPEHILPIGTVVLTETGEVPLMIISRASLYDDNGELAILTMLQFLIQRAWEVITNISSSIMKMSQMSFTLAISIRMNKSLLSSMMNL